jgi:hypothetical protein
LIHGLEILWPFVHRYRALFALGCVTGGNSERWSGPVSGAS